MLKVEDYTFSIRYTVTTQAWQTFTHTSSVQKGTGKALRIERIPITRLWFIPGYLYRATIQSPEHSWNSTFTCTIFRKLNWHFRPSKFTFVDNIWEARKEQEDVSN